MRKKNPYKKFKKPLKTSTKMKIKCKTQRNNNKNYNSIFKL